MLVRSQLNLLVILVFIQLLLPDVFLRFLLVLVFTLYNYSCFSRFKVKQSVIVLLWICFGLLHFNFENKADYGRVVKVTDSTITVNNFISNQCYFTSEQIEFDAVVEILESDEPTNKSCVRAKHIEIKKAPRGIIKHLYTYLNNGKYENLKSFVFDFYWHDSNQVLVFLFLSGSKVKAITTLFYKLVRLRMLEFLSYSLIVVFLCLYIYLFGLSISVFRIFSYYVFSLFKRTRTNRYTLSILVLAITINNPIHSLSFMFPFVLFLNREILKKSIYSRLNLWIVQFMLLGRANLIEIWVGQIIQKVSAFLFIMILLFCVVNISPDILEATLEISSFLSQFITNFTLYGKWSIYLVIFYYSAIAIVRAEYQKYAISLVLVLNIFISFYRPYLVITFINVGQGDSILLQYQSENILIDTGKPASYLWLKQALMSRGVQNIHHLIITHDDIDHNGNLENLMQDYNILSLSKSKQDTINSNLPLVTLLDDFHFLTTNENSRILYLSANGISFLFTGDATAAQEEILIREYPQLSVDILKLGHHGSNTSSSLEFLNQTKPSIAIASAQESIYGHPHQEVVKNLYHTKTKLLKTEEHGNISFYISNLLQYYITDQNEFGIIGWGS